MVAELTLFALVATLHPVELHAWIHAELIHKFAVQFLKTFTANRIIRLQMVHAGRMQVHCRAFLVLRARWATSALARSSSSAWSIHLRQLIVVVCSVGLRFLPTNIILHIHEALSTEAWDLA